MVKQPTVINGRWQMSWITSQGIAQRDMNIFEWIRYFPRILLQEITGYKFPKYK
jgi:hypothetical protein